MGHRLPLPIPGLPGLVVEEDRVALPLGEPELVRQVLRVGLAEHTDGDAVLLQLAQALLGLLDGQALRQARCEVLLRLHRRGGSGGQRVDSIAVAGQWGLRRGLRVL